MPGRSGGPPSAGSEPPPASTAAAAGVSGAPAPPFDTMRWRMVAYRGSRSFSIASNGDAMKIDEYAPVSRPTSRARPKSCSAWAPRAYDPITSTDRIGMMATSEVLIDRISTWFIERLTVSP